MIGYSTILWIDEIINTLTHKFLNQSHRILYHFHALAQKKGGFCDLLLCFCSLLFDMSKGGEVYDVLFLSILNFNC